MDIYRSGHLNKTGNKPDGVRISTEPHKTVFYARSRIRLGKTSGLNCIQSVWRSHVIPDRVFSNLLKIEKEKTEDDKNDCKIAKQAKSLTSKSRVNIRASIL